MESIVQVKNLRKEYRNTDLLKDINLTVNKGEVFGFVGHNGAGKSTLIHILTGIVNKTSGSFTIFDTPDNELNTIKRKMGVMPDITNLYHHMKGYNFLKYMGELTEDKRSKAGYTELLKKVGLEGAEDQKIKSYSFGMKKKISIAQALLGDSELIILDEPTSGLDPESAIYIRNLISELQKSGKTIFLTSHNLDEIERISDRVGILSNGVIKKFGTPEELKKVEEGSNIGFSVRTIPMLTTEKIEELTNLHQLNIIFGEGRQTSARLIVKSEEDIPKITKAIVDSGISLYEVKIDEKSLEDVFMNA